MNYYEIEVRKSFEQSYRFHINNLKANVPEYAQKLADIIRKKFKFLQLFPFSNPILELPNDTTLYRKLIIDKKYHIIYTVNNTTISVLYFSDGRQDPSTYFKLLDIFKSLN